MNRILLAVDGSEVAMQAVRQLLMQIALLREKPEIHVLHVHPPVPLGRVQAHVGKETLDAYYLEESLAQLAPAEAELTAAGCAFTRHVHVGQPADVIVRQADALDCSLIVIGSHGRSGLPGLLLGSVAQRVLQLSRRPVLVVK